MNALFWCVVALVVIATIYAIAHDTPTPTDRHHKAERDWPHIRTWWDQE